MEQFSTLKIGDIVDIYSDTYAENNHEGKAELVEFQTSHNEEVEFWLVQFVTDTLPNPVLRKILIHDYQRKDADG